MTNSIGYEISDFADRLTEIGDFLPEGDFRLISKLRQAARLLEDISSEILDT